MPRSKDLTNTMPEKLTRSERSRINGAKSRGPITPEGKAISSSNALKHGFAATINIVLSIEDEPAFHGHLQGVRDSFTPQNYMEETLVDQLASITWRQARLVALETAILEAQMSLQNKRVCAQYPLCADDNYFHLVEAWQALARPPQKQDSSREQKDPSLPPDGFDINSLELVRRYQTSLDRQFRNTLLNLSQYRKNFASSNPSLQLGPAKPEEPSAAPPPTPETAPSEASKPKPIALRPAATAQTSRPIDKIQSQTGSTRPVHPKQPVNSR